METRVDAVVVGATIRGLVAARVLAERGVRTALVERAPRVGGADGSFVTAAGNRFDHGLHVLDRDRSAAATRLFTEVLAGRHHRTTLRRAIAVRGHVVPYASESADLPPALRRLLRPGPLTDDIGDGLPTRERLAACYGTGWSDLIYDEVLPSYPSEARHAALGVGPEHLLVNIYPWFFPRADRPDGVGDESRRFHDRMRRGLDQDVLYPANGGFGGFAEALLAGLGPSIEVVTGASDLGVVAAPGSCSIDAVVAGGTTFVADRYFWGAGWAQLCAALRVPCQDVATDRVMLGSFAFSRGIESPYHEILVGDPDRHVNRIHFPARFRGADDPLVQVEFAVPAADEAWPDSAEHWRSRWLDDLAALGVIGPDHEIVDHDHRDFTMHFNGYGAEGEALHDPDPSVLGPDTNVFPVVASMANLNLNRYVGRAQDYVAAVLDG